MNMEPQELIELAKIRMAEGRSMMKQANAMYAKAFRLLDNGRALMDQGNNELRKQIKVKVLRPAGEPQSRISKIEQDARKRIELEEALQEAIIIGDTLVITDIIVKLAKLV